MAETYITIVRAGEGLYKEKGSRFLSFAFPVSDVEEIKDILSEYRHRYYDARHVCYAYMLGADRLNFRANDDGEPSGTAGRPILGQINSRNLTDVLVIVVRYFGGILLGTGGLITAYKQAAAEALDVAGIEERAVQHQLRVQFNYEHMNDVMRVIKEEDARVIDMAYETGCVITLCVAEVHRAGLLHRLDKLRVVRIL